MPPTRASARATSVVPAAMGSPARRVGALPATAPSAPGDCDSAAFTTIAFRAMPGQPFSATATPTTPSRGIVGGSASRISMRSASPSRVTFCGAAGSISSSRSGKKATLSGSAAPAGPCMRTTRVLPMMAESNFHPGASTGSWLRARSMCASQRASGAPMAGVTSNVYSSSPFSGMQTSLQTSHSTFAFSKYGPGAASAGGVMSVSSTTSSS